MPLPPITTSYQLNSLKQLRIVPLRPIIRSIVRARARLIEFRVQLTELLAPLVLSTAQIAYFLLSVGKQAFHSLSRELVLCALYLFLQSQPQFFLYIEARPLVHCQLAAFRHNQAFPFI